MTIRCFRWDDAGAPQLGAASSLSVVLEKCLVDGYGTQAGLGWGKIKSPSGKVIAFQPQARAASRPWLAFDDRCGASQYGQNMNGAAALGIFSALSSLTDDAGMEGVADIPFRLNWIVPYRRRDGKLLPWLIVSDSEKDYFYLILPWAADNVSNNAGIPGLLSNIGTIENRRKIGFSIAVFGSLPDSMAVESNNFIVTTLNIGTVAYIPCANGDVNSCSPNATLPFDIAFPPQMSLGNLFFWRSVSGIEKEAEAKVAGVPGLVSDGTKLKVKVPNAYSNKILVSIADMRLYCTKSAILRGRMGGIYPLLNTRDVFELNVDNVMGPFVQSIGGTDRLFLPILVASASLSRYDATTYSTFDYVCIDLTGPW